MKFFFLFLASLLSFSALYFSIGPSRSNNASLSFRSLTSENPPAAPSETTGSALEERVSQSCQGTPLHSTNPTAVMAWLRHNGNHNNRIEDVICCMPESLRQNYKVVHSSLSAQRSHYHSPRLLFGSIADGIMFSISGGDSTLPQSQSVEVMFDNPNSGQLELFDIEFSEGRRHISQSNPQDCINCHGNNGQVGIAGPRPIFNQFPWPRTATAAASSQSGGLCPQRGSYFNTSREVTFRSIRENPRFSCLPSPTEISDVTGKPANVVSFGIDGEMVDRNRTRVAIEMRYSPDFEKIKSFLIATVAGCFLQRSPQKGSDEVAVFPYGSPDEWFAPNFYAQMNHPPRNFNRALQGSFSEDRFAVALGQADQEHINQLHQEETRFAEFTRELENGGMPALPSTMGLMGCGESIEPATRNLYASVAAQMTTPAPRQYFMQQSRQMMERGFISSSPLEVGSVFQESLVLWAFESRGIHTNDWNIELSSFNPRDLRSTIGRLPEAQSIISSNDMENPQVRERVCTDLRERSLQRSHLNEDEPSESPGEVAE